MSKKPHISREEERRLGRLALGGDLAARHALVEAHYAFVIWVAARYGNCGVDSEELIQAGAMGLLEAIDRYDPDRPTRLLTMAFWIIRRRIIEAIKESTCFSRDGYRRAIRYSLDGGIPDELRTISMETPSIGGDDDEKQTLGSTLEDHRAVDPSEAACDGESVSISKKALRNIKKRTREIVQMRLGICRDKRPAMSFSDIAHHFGVSSERIRRIYVLAIRRIRSKLGDD